MTLEKQLEEFYDLRRERLQTYLPGTCLHLVWLHPWSLYQPDYVLDSLFHTPWGDEPQAEIPLSVWIIAALGTRMTEGYLISLWEESKGREWSPTAEEGE